MGLLTCTNTYVTRYIVDVEVALPPRPATPWLNNSPIRGCKSMQYFLAVDQYSIAWL